MTRKDSQHDDSEELSRIESEYATRRGNANVAGLYNVMDSGALFILQSRERGILRALRKSGRSDLSRLKILDVGCGNGGELRRFTGYGADPANLHGIDLLPDRLELARALSPRDMQYQQGNAAALPYPDGTFDLVLLYTVLSSVLDPKLRQAIAQDCRRVLKSGGAVVWYDFWVNPVNPATSGIGKGQLRQLFGDCNYFLHRATLAPPLARRLARVSWTAAELFNLLPFLRTHYCGLIEKKATDL